jgi:hypothetical protein
MIQIFSMEQTKKKKMALQQTEMKWKYQENRLLNRLLHKPRKQGDRLLSHPLKKIEGSRQGELAYLQDTYRIM